MADRTTFHVTPNANGWEVKREGSDTTEVLVDNKDNALDHAKGLAKAEALGQVIVHTRDGKIAEEFTYGDDPRNVPG
jgi:hypothetical protein